jgi:hypothetical protein
MYCKKNVIIAALVNISLASLVLGAVPAWDTTFGRADNESATSVQQTSDGGYILVGTTSTYGWGESDAWIIKTDYKGTRIWDAAFGGKYYDAATSVQQTSDGGYIIAGTTFSYGAGGSDAWIIKMDAKGNKVWDRTLGGVGNESASSVQQTSDGGYIIAGTTYTYGAGGSDAWIIKTDYKGLRMWDKTFGGTGNESASSVQQTSDGGYVIAGTTYTYGAGGSDAWIIKTDANGTRLLDKTFGETGNESASSVQQTSDSGYIVAGTTSSYGAGGTDAWLIKTDFRGNRLWDKTFGGTENDSASQVKQTKEGGYIVAGTTSSYGAGGTDAWLFYVLDGASATASSTETNKTIQGFDILTNAVGLLIAMYIVTKMKK